MAVAAAAITPTGVRDGERATLRALSQRRGPAVLGYCEQVCAPGHSLDAATDAFARFRALVVSSAQLHEIDPEALLLSATRHAAAARAPAPPPRARRGLRATGSRSCALMPELLAVRADGRLSRADRQRMERHLRRCPHCRDAEARWRWAETAYREATPAAPAGLAIEAIERALRRAAPTGVPNVRGSARDPEPGGQKPWRVPPLAVIEPPELPSTVAPSTTGRAGHTTDGDDTASPPENLPGPTMAWALPEELEPDGHGAAQAPSAPPPEDSAAPPAHPLDDELDATMAWALNAPDFDGPIVAADLRERPRAVEPPHDHDPPPPLAPGQAETAVASSHGRIRRLLLPLALVVVILLVALSLVGTLADPVHQHPTSPAAAPRAPTAGATSSSTAIAAPNRRSGHRRRNLRSRPSSGPIAATAGAIGSGRTLDPVRPPAAPAVNGRPSPTRPSAPAPPHPASAGAPVAHAPPTPSRAAPPSATNPAASGQPTAPRPGTPPPASSGPGGTQAP